MFLTVVGVIAVGRLGHDQTLDDVRESSAARTSAEQLATSTFPAVFDPRELRVAHVDGDVRPRTDAQRSCASGRTDLEQVVDREDVTPAD